jgi:membrane protein YdbS with pleckstrin-like domain
MLPTLEQDTSVDGLGADRPYRDEIGVLWSASEGQVTNAALFVVCALTFWLVGPLFYALYRAWWTANHRYIVTDQRLRESVGILSRRVEELELYRVKDISVQCTLLQTLFGRGSVTLLTSDRSTPTVVLRAIPNPIGVADMLRAHVQRCRVANGVREFDGQSRTA